MKVKSIALAVTVIISLCTYAYPLDWRTLHEQADSTSLPATLAEVEKNEDSLEALYVLALVYLNNHKDAEAGEIFKKILSLNPRTIEAQWGLAEVLRRKKKMKESEAVLNKIIKANPRFSPAYISLAYLKYTQTKFTEAVRLALKVQKQGRDKVDLSNYTRAYLIYAGAKGMIASRGGPLSKLVNGTAVLPNLKKAEKLQPESVAVLFGLGSFYFLAPPIAGGNIDKALTYLAKAIKIDPLFADAYVRLAQIYKAKKDMQKYQEYIEKALKIDPNNELALDAIGGVCKFSCVTVQE
ncbi:MAG: tetratricopeptide repeat protein [Candidatus Omnitrophota bacterium]|nr:MAG: tetratricopeptide repeat protein [Candidatus Omnitrophota bacterium]